MVRKLLHSFVGGTGVNINSTSNLHAARANVGLDMGLRHITSNHYVVQLSDMGKVLIFQNNVFDTRTSNLVAQVHFTTDVLSIPFWCWIKNNYIPDNNANSFKCSLTVSRFPSGQVSSFVLRRNSQGIPPGAMIRSNGAAIQGWFVHSDFVV